MAIQVLKPKFEVEECLDAVRECLEKGWTGMGLTSGLTSGLTAAASGLTSGLIPAGF